METKAAGRKRRRKKIRSWLVNLISVPAAVLLLVIIGCAIFLSASGDDAPRMPVISTDPGAESPRDTVPPVLSGIHDFTIYQGDTISYMSGITADDEADPDPAVTVDTSAVDLSRPGEYQIIYTAADASGNISHATAIVTVLEKQEDFVDLDTIYAAADAKLDEIIRENPTTKEQVHDIYAWARLNLSYGGHSDRTDWRQTAYVMLTEGKGDCYGYYAVTKLMFERQGIPNIDVQKVRNHAEDSDHFWSLVSLDGGETYYHFDATPRAGDGDDFCLVTDSFIDAYSEAHDGSHNRDKSLYPETP